MPVEEAARASAAPSAADALVRSAISVRSSDTWPRRRLSLLPSREQPLGAWNEAGRCVMWRARPVLTTQGRATLGAKGRGRREAPRRRPDSIPPSIPTWCGAVQGRATLGAKGRGCGRGRSDQWRFEDTERLLAATVAREARSARSCSLSLRRPRTSVPKPCGERRV